MKSSNFRSNRNRARLAIVGFILLVAAAVYGGQSGVARDWPFPVCPPTCNP